MGVAALIAQDFGDVQHVVIVLQADGADRVVVLFLLTDGEVERDEHVGPGDERHRPALEVLLEEVRPVIRHRVLLVQGGPEARADGAFDLVELLYVVARRVQGLALASEQPAVLGRRLQGDQVSVVVEVFVVLSDGGVLDHHELVSFRVGGHGRL